MHMEHSPDHMLGHKTSLNGFKKIKTISSIFSDHNSMKLEISYQKNSVKSTDMQWLNNMLQTTNGSRKKSKRKSETPRNICQQKHDDPNIMQF